jgi:hypothetical protein
VALTCLTVLAVVTSIEDKSALETVAIALAILAFVVQIIVYIAQAEAAAAALRRSQDIYAETLRVLTEIRERSEGTQAAVTQQFDKVLEHALAAKLPGAATQKELASPELAREVAASVSAAINAPRPPPPGSTRTKEYPEPRSSDENAEVLAYMAEWPSKEDFEELWPVAEDMSVSARSMLAVLAQDEIAQRRPDARLGPGLYVGSSADRASLEQAGLAESLPGHVDEDGKHLVVLTPRGRRLARAFTARGAPPDYVPDGVKQLITVIRALEELE